MCRKCNRIIGIDSRHRGKDLNLCERVILDDWQIRSQKDYGTDYRLSEARTSHIKHCYGEVSRNWRDDTYDYETQIKRIKLE